MRLSLGHNLLVIRFNFTRFDKQLIILMCFNTKVLRTK